MLIKLTLIKTLNPMDTSIDIYKVCARLRNHWCWFNNTHIYIIKTKRKLYTKTKRKFGVDNSQVLWKMTYNVAGILRKNIISLKNVGFFIDYQTQSESLVNFLPVLFFGRLKSHFAKCIYNSLHKILIL